MAQRVKVLVESDLTGEQGASTVRFALDGTSYEVDLTDAEREEFHGILAPYLGAARKAAASPVRGSGRGQARPALNGRTGPDPKAVRAWAASQGIDVPTRGRIPNAVLVQFSDAGN